MAEETADLDRLFARLSEEGRHLEDPDDHPSPEALMAYLADELPPEEDDAIQEHLTQCALCAGLLPDLKRFLDPLPEDRPREDVADFETAAEWRELREKLRESQAQSVPAKRGLLRKISGAPALAAVLALLLVGAAYRIRVLDRELARPIPVQITTLEAEGSKKGTRGVDEPTPFRLGNVAVFETHSERPYPKYRLSFRDKEGRVQTVDAQEDENGMIALVLPRDFLSPGLCRVEVSGIEGTTADSLREFYIRILE